MCGSYLLLAKSFKNGSMDMNVQLSDWMMRMSTLKHLIPQASDDLTENESPVQTLLDSKVTWNQIIHLDTV